MTLGTILVHLDHLERCTVRVEFAAALARLHGSHLVGLIPTGLYDDRLPGSASAGAPGDAGALAAATDYLRVRAEAIAHVFRDCIRGPGALSYDVRVVDELAVDAVIRHGRSSDLVIVGQADGDDEADALTDWHLPQQVVLQAGRPILIVPRAGPAPRAARRVLVAWDGTREAAVALRDALPLLARASQVTLVSLHAANEVPDQGALLLAQLLAWLLRHGVQAQAQQHVAAGGLAEALLSQASRLDADLVVMGGYGHTRLRELVLGGVTREILARMDRPVLMAH